MNAGDIAFRPLTTDDLEQLFLWLIRPHVIRGYAPAPGSFAEMVAKYGPRTDPANVVKSFIVAAGARDIGYVQWYDVADFPEYEAALGCGKGVACIDFFIGESAFLGQGIGAMMARRFVDEEVFASARFRECVAGAVEGQAAAIRALESAGFRRWKVVQVGGAAPECVMRRER